MSKEEVAQLHCKLAATNFGHLPEPTQYARDEGCLSPDLAWVHMEETQPGSAATGGGRVGTDDTSLIERVESSSFVSAEDRLLVHQQFKNYCMSWRCPWNPTQFSCSSGEASTGEERHNFPGRKLEDLRFEA